MIFNYHSFIFFSCFITKDYKKPLKFNSFICFFFFILSIYTLDKKNDVRILLWKQGKKKKEKMVGGICNGTCNSKKNLSYLLYTHCSPFNFCCSLWRRMMPKYSFHWYCTKVEIEDMFGNSVNMCFKYHVTSMNNKFGSSQYFESLFKKKNNVS